MFFQENLFYCENKLNGVGLYCCGKRFDARNHSFGPTSREYYWLVYLQNGSGQYTIENRTFDVRQGQIFITFPNVRTFYRADKGSTWNIRWVGISSNAINDLFDKLGVSIQNPVFSVANQSETERIMEELFATIAKRDLSSETKSISLVYELFSVLCNEEEKSVQKRDPVSDAMYYAIHNYDQPIGTTDLSKVVGFERSYFSRLFRKKTGVSPSRWLFSLRMEKARDLLLSTDLNVSEISTSVGFSDPLYFSRAFKENFGDSPTEYKKKNV